MSAVEYPQLILAATDGSPAARAAVTVAAQLAAAHDAELVIVRVLPASEYRLTRLGPQVPIERERDDPFKDPVLREARRTAFENGVAAKLVLIEGDTTDALVNCAARRNVDLVVLGQPHQASGRLSARGRVATNVARRASCRVQTVRAPS